MSQIEVFLSHSAQPSPPPSPTQPPPPLPVLPERFSHVAAFAIVGTGETSVFRRWSDKKGNLARVEYTESGETKSEIYHYVTQEFFGLIEDDDESCLAFPAAGIDPTNAQPMEFMTTVDDDKKRHVGDPFEFRHLMDSGVNKTFLAREKLRGVMTQRWMARIPDGKESIYVEWWFTLPKDGKEIAVPIQTMYQSGTEMYYYDYAEFLPYIEDEEGIFQTPPMMFCADRSAGKSPPLAPRTFSAKIEIVRPQSALFPVNVIESDAIFVSAEFKLCRLDHTPGAAANQHRFGVNPLSIVHDDSTFITYVQDKVLGNCTVLTPDFTHNGTDDFSDSLPVADDFSNLLNLHKGTFSMVRNS